MLTIWEFRTKSPPSPVHEMNVEFNSFILLTSMMIGLICNAGESLPIPDDPANSMYDNSTETSVLEYGTSTMMYDVMEQAASTVLPKECLVRVIEVVDGEETLSLYNATKEEVEVAGLEIFDEICKDDLLDWNRVLKNPTLCSLVEPSGMCQNGKKPEEFRRRVKMLPKKKKLVRDEEDDKTLLERMGDNFLNGHSIYIRGWVVRFPVRLPPFLYITCAVGILIKMVLNYDNLVLIIDCAHMMIHMVVGLQTTLIATKQKVRIMVLKDQLNKFEDVPGMEGDSARIKEECERQVMNLYRPFSRCILVTINIYVLFPICKLFTEAGRSKLSKVLVWQMWLGVPEDTWWGFTTIFLFELVTSLFLLLSVMYAVPYLACLGKITVGHCKLLILRLESLNIRAVERSARMSESYEAALNYEIDDCARHLHENQRMANEVADVYKYYLSSFYYGGMFALCMSGLQAVAANEDIEESLKFMGVLTGELVAIGLATYVSEGIIEGFADVRSSIYNLPWYDYPKLSGKRLHLMTTMCSFRGLRTMFGYELTLLHFGDVLNASYKYYNLLLLTMK